LLGIVTVDDIIDVIDDEAASDYSGLAGVNVEEINENPVKAASRRLPWLITLLFLGMSTASLISHYEELSERSEYFSGIHLFDHRYCRKCRNPIFGGCCPSLSDF
jgi:Mg/Co/Ni transporter MgtE